MDNNYSLAEEQREYEIESNPELQRNELNPSVAKVMYSHEKVYKTLATVGDFVCHIWYYDDNYDPQRSTEGSKRIHIVPTDNILKHDTDSIEVNNWFNVANDKWPQGVIFVNPIIRRNGVKFVSNSDLRDCVKYMSGVAAHYDANSSDIVSIDVEDGNKMYEMSYDVSSSKIYSDVSNNTYEDFTTGAVGNGSLSLSYDQSFGSGQISMSSLAITLGGSSPENFSQYYRGDKVANISQNNNVPTSGTFSFSQLRNVTSGVTANANGNWQHLQARHEVFTGGLWESTLNKRLNVNGNVGGTNSDPALRFNNSGQGKIDVYINNTSGSPCVRGVGGDGGAQDSGGGVGGGAGEPGRGAIHVASPIRMSNDHLNNRIKAGGGGGGGGGRGGNGGGGGHGGGRRCRGWFCNSSERKCHNNGGAGGEGGAGGNGGIGAGYVWNGNNAFAAHSGAGGGGGSGGSGGSSRGGGRGGNGGNGGNGGGFESSGSTGSGGTKGSRGDRDEQGCGYKGPGRQGRDPNGGGAGGSGAAKMSTSHNGSVTNI